MFIKLKTVRNKPTMININNVKSFTETYYLECEHSADRLATCIAFIDDTEIEVWESINVIEELISMATVTTRR